MSQLKGRSKSFLQLIHHAKSGRLKIYLGYAPGVGKSYLMLQEAHRLKKAGIDVVIAAVETYNRAETCQLVEGLDAVPMRQFEYKGITTEEMNVEAVLARQPQVVLVDELAHANVPGSRNQKRSHDVRELLAAGIHVISTLNIQHLESLNNTIEELIGIKVHERVPDAIVAGADQIVNVDLAPEDLRERLDQGKIYPPERLAKLESLFKLRNLEYLRELALRETAAQIDLKFRDTLSTDDYAASDQIMVCLASKGTNAARMLRFASRLAGRLNRNWYAVYVQTAKESPSLIDSKVKDLLSETFAIAKQLGATVFIVKDEDISDAILRFAKEYRIGLILIGRPKPLPKWQRYLLGKRSIAEDLMLKAKGHTVVVIDAEAQEINLTPAPSHI